MDTRKWEIPLWPFPRGGASERPSPAKAVVDAAQACPGRARNRMGAQYRGEGGTPARRTYVSENKKQKPIQPQHSAREDIDTLASNKEELFKGA